jgi:O-antigen/teichoic acid export membrane protein
LKVDKILRNGFLVVLIGTSLSAALGFISNVFLARTISIDNFGQLAFFYTCIVTVFSLWEMGFGAHYVVKINQSSELYTEDRTKEMNSLYHRVKIRYGLPMGLILTALPVYIYDLSVLDYFGIFIGALCLTQHKFLLSVCQAKADWTRFSFFQSVPMLYRILAYVLIIIGVNFFNLPADILISIKIGLCCSLVLSVISTEKLTPKYYLLTAKSSKSMQKFLFDGAVIQAFINTAIVLFSRMDIFLLMYFINSKDVALYFAANTLAMVFPLITRSLMSFYLQKISSSSNREASNLLGKQLNYLPVVIVISIVLYFSGDYIMDLIYGQNYGSGGNILAILAFGYLGGIIFTPFEAYFYSRDASVVLKIKIMSVVVMVAFSLALVEFYGAVGIAFALMFAKLFGWLMVTFFYSKEKLNENLI